ncbi:MAG TPA: type II toxin-antitoxin system VapC family toxin [Streptosporangiaceae bacterium]|nr:type II toxin-antitoxin system VapC family toxin [Streptosporangiaceae bacterium]
MIYLDSSALVKLILAEPESQALQRWLAEQADLALVSSTLHRTEVPRAVWRADPTALPRSLRQLRGVDKVPVTTAIADSASVVPPQVLHSSAAIHVASALSVRRELSAFVAYDKRLLAAAREAGLPVASPA